MINEFKSVFALDDFELGHTSGIKCYIETGGHPPVKLLSYHTPISRHGKISEMIDAFHGQGVIKPSISPWASPVVLVPKKDGSFGFALIVEGEMQ